MSRPLPTRNAPPKLTANAARPPADSVLPTRAAPPALHTAAAAPPATPLPVIPPTPTPLRTPAVPNNRLNTILLFTTVLPFTVVFMQDFSFAVPAILLGGTLVALTISMKSEKLLNATRPPPQLPDAGAPAPRTTNALSSYEQRAVQQSREYLQQALIINQQRGNPRRAFEARRTLNVHLQDTVDRYAALPPDRRDPAVFTDTLRALLLPAAPDDGDALRAWQEQLHFIRTRSAEDTSSAAPSSGDLKL